MKMDMKKVFQFRDGVYFFAFEEHSFVIDTATCLLYDLGLSSALISGQFEGRQSLAEIVDVVKQYYLVSSSVATEAVVKFVKMMEERDLIEAINC